MAESTRRDFLRGKAAGKALGEAVDRAMGDDAMADDDVIAGGYTMRVSRRAMACQFEVCLDAMRYANATDVALEALDAVDAIEEQMSFFRPSSELTRINLLAADGPVEVEPRLFDLLTLSWEIHRQTDGAFDLTATPLWELWGFSRRSGDLPSQAEIDEALERVGARHVALDAERRTVRFLRGGVRLNLGAIGKGYAIDRCGEKLCETGIEHFLISGGFSSLLARGQPPSAAGLGAPGEAAAGPGWTVGLRNPLRPDRRFGEIRLADRALATSGSYLQAFRFGGKRYGHILDPRTGWPAQDVLSATVLAPTAAVADALSTAFCVMGRERVEAFCRSQPEIGAVLLCPSRGRGGMAVHTFGLAAGDIRFYDPATVD